MAKTSTFSGVVRRGRIESSAAAELPEGSNVIVLATGKLENPLFDPYLARQKANGWLVSRVGSVIAQQPQLQQKNGNLIWRFKAFLAAKGLPLRGPVGFVDVDAYSGEILANEQMAQTIMMNAVEIARSLPPTGG
jgi:hypothetical protein